MYPELLQQLVSKLELSLQNYQLEAQNSEYDGAIFSLVGKAIRYRKGKVTPKKNGHFVAFWEKDAYGKNQAYIYEHAPDILVVAVEEEHKAGYFIFPKEVLKTKKVYQTSIQKGKMGIRLYAPWCQVESLQAVKTQAWQVAYFINQEDATFSQQFHQFLAQN